MRTWLMLLGGVVLSRQVHRLLMTRTAHARVVGLRPPTAGGAAAGPALVARLHGWYAAVIDVAGRARRARRLEASLPPVIDAVARSLRTNPSMADALAAGAGAVDGELAQTLLHVAARARISGPTAALEEWGQTTDSPGIRLMSAAMALGIESGGAHARAIDQVGETIRADLAVAAEIRSLSTQARSSAVIIAASPIAFTFLATATDPRVGSVLFGSAFGAFLLIAGAVLDTVGALWMASICRRADPVRGAEDASHGLAEAVDLLAVAVGAGLTVRLAVEAVAVRAVGGFGDQLRIVVAECERGRLLADALDDVPGRAGDRVRPVTAALSTSARYGTALGPSLERLARDIRDGRRRQAEVAARRVPVKLLFPLVLFILPAFGLLTIGPVLASAIQSLRLS